MRHKLLFSFFIFLIVALPIRSKDFVLTSGQTVVIACSPSEELVVRTALEMLGRDIQTNIPFVRCLSLGMVGGRNSGKEETF